MELSIEGTPGKILKVFNAEETHLLGKQWMNIFCSHNQGVNIKQFKWHIFSSGRYPSIAGEDATREYLKQISSQYILLPNQGNQAIITDTKPSSCNIADFYVFPPNMAWIMAFTHEKGWLGPYFALHPNYKSLAAENEKHRYKLQEIELAKQNGWC